MKRHIFIHGSAGGQSTFKPIGAPERLCDQLANEYFKGRTMRTKESAGKFTLFVELCETNDGKYCIYSFLNNECLGPNGGREGNYFAITILCKDAYVFPEVIYQMLSSAYSSMLKEKHILNVNRDGKDQYVISQFTEAQDYLAKFLDLVEKGFDNITGGAGNSLPDKTKAADYDSWRGFKVNLENCNSLDAFNQLCAVGRLYISEEYESNKAKLVNLQKKVADLEEENKKLLQQQAQDKLKKDSTIKAEINSLKSQIEAKEAKIQELSDTNEDYKTTIETVRKQLDKFAKVGKKITENTTEIDQSQKKGMKELLKIALLLFIFILTLLSCVMNYLFFRDLSLDSESKKEKSEITIENNNEDLGSTEDEGNINTGATTGTFEINPVSIEAEAAGFSGNITITSDSDWGCPKSTFNWVTLTKVNETTLKVTVKAQTSTDERKATFMVKSGDNEKQITVRQKGKTVQPETVVVYNIIVTDAETGNQLANGSSVSPGQRLNVRVENPSLAQGFGWTFQNCSGNDNKKNVKDVNVTVGGEDKTVIISYGDTKDSKKRTKFSLKIKKEETPPEGDKAGLEDTENQQKQVDTNGESGEKFQ